MPNFSIISLCIMQLCAYVFSIGMAFHYMCPKMSFLGGFEGEDVKILSSNPQKALPCVNTRLLMYRMTKSVQRPEPVRGKILRTKKEIKKLSGNFGYMGRRNPWGDLAHMWHVGRYGGHNHVCNIW